jgi:3-hydroxyacyl-[acyl-carrier-protein] dehydratase
MKDATSMDRAAIEAAIPHRDPFLFVDRVVSRSDDELVAEWRVPEDADWFRGHDPGRPVLPGVLLCEHVLQCAALLVAGVLGALGAGPGAGVPVVTKLESARFRRMVAPGDALSTRVALTERVGPAFYGTGNVSRAGASVLRVAYCLALSGSFADVAGER